VDLAQPVEDAKDIEQPQDDADDHDAIEDRFDIALHRDEPIHKPEQKADNDERDHETDEGHRYLISETAGARR
jgi:hypothetical protein